MSKHTKGILTSALPAALVVLMGFVVFFAAAPSASAKAPPDPASRIACLVNSSYTSGNALAASFSTDEAYATSAARITVCLSGTARAMNITVSDGNSTETMTLNAGQNLEAGYLYTGNKSFALDDPSDDLLAVLKAALDNAPSIAQATGLTAPGGASVFSTVATLRAALGAMVDSVDAANGNLNLASTCNTFQANFLNAAKAYS